MEIAQQTSVVEKPVGEVNPEAFGLERLCNQNRQLVHGLLAFLALATLTVYYLPPLVRADVYTDDMRQHISWYYAARNPGLFHDDLLQSYFTGNCPLGYKALFKSVCIYVDPQTFGEILSLVLGVAGVFLVYKVGTAVTSGSVAGGATAVLLLLFGNALGLHQFIKVFQGGLQRAFGLPIFLLGTWALLRQRLWVLYAAMVLGALFFPPVCVSLAAFSGMVLGWRFLKRQEPYARVLKDAATVTGVSFLCAGILIVAKAPANGHWTVYTLQEAMRMPEYYAGGMWDVLIDKPILYHKWSDYFTKALTVPHSLLLLAVTLIFLGRVREHRSYVVLLIVSALLTWGAAYAALFNLYEPSRYILYPLMTLWLLVTPGAMLETIRLLDGKLRLRSLPAFTTSSRFKISLAMAFIVLVGCGASCLAVYRIRTGQGGMIGSAPPEVYKFLHSLPADVKIAAHPVDADDIPMRSQRSVLAFLKALFPYHRECYEELKARVTATWKGLYATNVQDILPLRAKYGADVLVVNKRWYEKEPPQGKPFSEILESCRSKLQGAIPLVLHLPRETILFESGLFTIIDLRALERLQGLGAVGEGVPSSP